MNDETQTETKAEVVSKVKPSAAKKPAAKKTGVAKKPTARKTRVTKKPAASARVTTAKKKTVSVKNPQEEHRKAAADSRHELVKKLKEDLKGTKKTLKAAKAAAKNEIAVLKDQLDAALKREKQLMKISEKKAKEMLAAGARWEKKQVSKIKKAAEKARKAIKK